MTQEIDLGDDSTDDGNERPEYCDEHCECLAGRGHPARHCSSVSPDGSLTCTRPDGHDGPHSGCGIARDEHPMGTWE